MIRLATIATSAALVLSACAPAGAAEEPSWTEPDHYVIDAVFSGAWFYSGWFELEIEGGVIVSSRTLDSDADEFAESMDVPAFFSTPRQVLDRAEAAQPVDGLNLEFTITQDLSGNPAVICWDDPMALDEEGCWTFRDYRVVGQVSGDWVEPDSYTYKFGHSYFGPGAGVYLVTVQGGEVIAFEATDERSLEAIQDEWVTIEQMRTIGEVLDIYERALRTGASDATITYDDVTGAPSHVTIDWIREAADDEDYFEISDIVVN